MKNKGQNSKERYGLLIAQFLTRLSIDVGFVLLKLRKPLFWKDELKTNQFSNISL